MKKDYGVRGLMKMPFSKWYICFLLSKNRMQSMYFGFIIENWGHFSIHFVVTCNLSAKSLLFLIDGGVTKLIQIAIPHLHFEVNLIWKEIEAFTNHNLFHGRLPSGIIRECEWYESTEKLKVEKIVKQNEKNLTLKSVFIQRIVRYSIRIC